MAILFQPGDAPGAAQRDALALEIEKAALQFTVAGLPIRWLSLPANAPDLADRLRTGRVAAVLVVGAAARDPQPICRATRAAGVLSASTDRAAVEACLAVGLLARGGKATLLVNLPAAQAEGADLEPGLLARAELLGQPGRR